MRLSRKSEYVLLALFDLAEHYRDKTINIADLAKRKAIPKKYLEQVLLTLKRAVGKFVNDMGILHPFVETCRWEFADRDIRGTELYGGVSPPVQSSSKGILSPPPTPGCNVVWKIFRGMASRCLEQTKDLKS